MNHDAGFAPREFLRQTWHRVREDRLSTGASSAAFYLVLSIVPALAAAASLFELVVKADLIGELTRGLQGLVPSSAGVILQRQVDSAIQSEQGTKSSWLEAVAWFAVLLWSGSRGTGGLVDALNVVHDRVEERPWLRRTGIRLLLTLGAILLLLVTIPAILLVPDILAKFGLSISAAAFGFRWPVLFLLATGAIAALYRFGPSRREPEWRWILLGSASAAALWMCFSGLLAWYIETFGSLNRIYGSFGALAAFMIWIWLSAFAVLLGAEIDAGASGIRKPPQLPTRRAAR